MSNEERVPAFHSVKDITKADFQQWKHHPVSKMFLQFLQDKKQFLKEIAFQEWINGALSFDPEKALRGQIIELEELCSMEFESIYNFYQTEDNGTKNP